MGDGLERWKDKFRREGEKEGIKEGIKKGIKEGIELSIKGLIRENCSNEMISRICNVNDAYINKIRKKIK